VKDSFSGALRTGITVCQAGFGLFCCSVDCYAWCWKIWSHFVLDYPHTPCGVTSSWHRPPPLWVDTMALWTSIVMTHRKKVVMKTAKSCQSSVLFLKSSFMIYLYTHVKTCSSCGSRNMPEKWVKGHPTPHLFYAITSVLPVRLSFTWLHNMMNLIETSKWLSSCSSSSPPQWHLHSWGQSAAKPIYLSYAWVQTRDLWFGKSRQRLTTNTMSSQNRDVVEQRNLVKLSAHLNFSLVIVVVHLFGDSNDQI